MTFILYLLYLHMQGRLKRTYEKPCVDFTLLTLWTYFLHFSKKTCLKILAALVTMNHINMVVKVEAVAAHIMDKIKAAHLNNKVCLLKCVKINRNDSYKRHKICLGSNGGDPGSSGNGKTFIIWITVKFY